jgi:hypothetical protein
MKKIGLLLFAALMIISCSENDDNLSGDQELTAKIDSVTWFADVESSNTSAELFHSTFLSISGSETDPTKGAFLANIRDYKGKGTYKIGVGSSKESYARFTTGSVAANYQSWNAETSENEIGTGTIEIISDNGSVVTGAFNLILYNKTSKSSKNVTDGSFKLNLKK